MVIQSWYSSGYRLTNCSAMVTANVTLHGAGSMGFGEFGGEGANLYKDCRNIRRPDSTHLLSSNHDGFHSYAVAHGPTLENLEIGFCGDDALNIHSVLSLVLKRADATDPTLYIIDTGLPDAYSFNGRVGDVAEFYDIQHVATSVGERTITTKREVTDPAVLAEAHTAMMHVNAQCSGGCG